MCACMCVCTCVCHLQQLLFLPFCFIFLWTVTTNFASSPQCGISVSPLVNFCRYFCPNYNLTWISELFIELGGAARNVSEILIFKDFFFFGGGWDNAHIGCFGKLIMKLFFSICVLDPIKCEVCHSASFCIFKSTESYHSEAFPSTDRPLHLCCLARF